MKRQQTNPVRQAFQIAKDSQPPRRKAKRKAAPVEVIRVNPLALKEALKLARGDQTRVKVQRDGSVLVVNG